MNLFGRNYISHLQHHKVLFLHNFTTYHHLGVQPQLHPVAEIEWLCFVWFFLLKVIGLQIFYHAILIGEEEEKSKLHYHAQTSFHYSIIKIRD